MGLGELLGDIWGGVRDVLPEVLPVATDIVLASRTGRAPEIRSLPPTVYQTAEQRRRAAGFGDLIEALPDPSTWYGGQPSTLGRQIEGFIDDPVGSIRAMLGPDQPDPYSPSTGGMSMAGALIPHAQHRPLFRARPSGAVGQRVIPVTNPVSGKTHFFGDLGTPLLFSRDFSAHKRVNRLARKAARKR